MLKKPHTIHLHEKLNEILGPIIRECGLGCNWPTITAKSYRFHHNHATTVDILEIEVNSYLKRYKLTDRFNVLTSTSRVGDNVLIIQLKDKYFNEKDLDNMLTLIKMVDSNG